MGSFDLTSLQHDPSYQANGFLVAHDVAHQASYLFNPCANLSRVECASPRAQGRGGAPAAVLASGLVPSSLTQGPGGQGSDVDMHLDMHDCTPLGLEATAECDFSLERNLSCAYTGVDGGISVEIRYSCAHTLRPLLEATAKDNVHHIHVAGQAGCVATNKRDRERPGNSNSSAGLLTGYLDDVLGLANTTSWLDMAKKLEGMAPGAVALLAVSSTLCLCFCGLSLCYARFKLRRIQAQYEERLRLVSAKTSVDVFRVDDDDL